MRSLHTVTQLSPHCPAVVIRTCTDVGLSFIVRLLQALDSISHIIRNPCLEFSVLTLLRQVLASSLP